jgi:hypothetical protein
MLQRSNSSSSLSPLTTFVLHHHDGQHGKPAARAYASPINDAGIFYLKLTILSSSERLRKDTI